MNRACRVAAAVAGLAVIAACANNDVYLRPERTTFMKLDDDKASTPLRVAGANVELTCLDWKGNRATRPIVINSSLTTETSDIQCLYVSVELKQIADQFPVSDLTTASSGRLKVASTGGALLLSEGPDFVQRRNLYYSFLRNIADQNCQTFLGRSFANKASIETARSTFQDLLTGSSAAVATAVPPAAAGLSLVNLFAGKTIDNINSTFYYEKTFQAMAGAIAIERERIKREMDSHKGDAYDSYTVFDLINDLRRYDDACSVRVGVTKLQELAQEKQKAQREEQ